MAIDFEEHEELVLNRGRVHEKYYSPYTPIELYDMFKPYIKKLDKENLSAREVRLLETILKAWQRVV